MPLVMGQTPLLTYWHLTHFHVIYYFILWTFYEIEYVDIL